MQSRKRLQEKEVHGNKLSLLSEIACREHVFEDFISSETTVSHKNF